MALSRAKTIGRREQGLWIGLPVNVLSSENFRTLTPNAKNLMWCLLSQIQLTVGGIKNNGDLCATHTIAKRWGIASKETLKKAIDELLERGWIEQTREVVFSTGQRNTPNLYALTFFAIDSCGGKCRPTKTPSSKWNKIFQN